MLPEVKTAQNRGRNKFGVKHKAISMIYLHHHKKLQQQKTIERMVLATLDILSSSPTENKNNWGGDKTCKAKTVIFLMVFLFRKQETLATLFNQIPVTVTETRRGGKDQFLPSSNLCRLNSFATRLLFKSRQRVLSSSLDFITSCSLSFSLNLLRRSKWTFCLFVLLSH